MNRRIPTVPTVMLLLLLVSVLGACSGSKGETVVPTIEQEEVAPAALDGRLLLEERCSSCHGLGQVERARKTEEQWKATVERMVRKGAQLNQEEQEAVIQYLAETYRP